MKATLDRYFHISERGSSIGTELRAGTVSFFAMAYIILLNPLILGTTEDADGYALGVPQVAAATALVAGVMSILFGAIAKYPFAMAAGLGMNTFVGVSMVATSGLTWQESMGLVVIEGIGMFIAMIGLVDGGFVTRVPDAAHTTVPVGLGINGSISTWPALVFVIGLIICSFMVIRNVPGGLFIAIVLTTIIAFIVQAFTGSEDWGMAAPVKPEALGGIPDLSIVGDVNLVGAFTKIGVVSTVLLIFTLLLTNFFDAMGTMTGLGKQGKLVDAEGNLPDMKKALVVEGFGAVAGGLGSASSNTVFADSSAGIADGARTGLANLMTGLLFLAAMFLTPLYEIVPIEAASPVLVIVGVMMAAQLTEIRWTKMEIAIPAFLTIVIMPFTYSIANGIGVGFISFALISTFAGKAKEVHWIMWLLAGLFVIFFGMDPISNAIG
ncbi:MULTISPECIES: NCS2 family permease [Corynebacterium]|uniref:NCS2 family permease n=1 Tax=Corynebacterium TaxID=1716 RepID=UPI001EF20EA9|nr:NCS2 family permease [Corynebacterium kefirresidentii]MCG7241855.1 NCS2 family permease [Corynebacterium kefirresidentii]MCG7284186.1 NCS2 family permease [Corynebacterium kefirresidentii]